MPTPQRRPVNDEPQGVEALFVQAGRRSKPSAAAAAPVPPASPSSAVAGPVGPTAEELSQRYQALHRLAAGERIIDGFCDHVFDGVLVDRASDDKLETFLQKVKKKLQKASDPVTTLMVMALLVSDASGRSGPHTAGLIERATQRLREERCPDGYVPLGSLLGDQARKRKVQGACLVRHRALVFKVLADSLGSPECSLERDRKEMTAWNVVQHDGVGFVVDLIHDPGTLYEVGSPKHQEYLQLLRLGCEDQLQTISMRPELPGRVPRPPWHAEATELHYGREAQDQLGKGGFGEVYRGTWAEITVAIKVVKDKDPSDYDILDFILEIALLSRLNHPNVMRFWRGSVELASGRKSLVMVTEFIEKGGLSTLLHGHDGPRLPDALTIAQALWLSLGVARGMQYLHSCEVLHLDLKSPNVLIDGTWAPKLCDFGLAKIKARETEAGFQTTLRGVSPIWAPPEMFDDQADPMSERADVYSYGIVFFEVITRQLPFQEVGQRQLPRAKFEGVLPQVPKDVPRDCASFVMSCCAHRPSARPSMTAVVAKLQELAAARGLDLADVVMPAWRGAQEAQADRETLRQLEERKARLRREKQQLQQQLEQARERRKRIQEVHLSGQAVPAEESLPLLSSSLRMPGETLGAVGPGAAAEAAAASTVGLEHDTKVSLLPEPKKACCRLA